MKRTDQIAEEKNERKLKRGKRLKGERTTKEEKDW
jgi:hypothetical protein